MAEVAAKDVVAEEKAVVPAPEEEEESKDLVVVAGDVLLTKVATEKRMSLIKAWEENEKAKADNKAAKKLADIAAWENSKVAEIEAEIKKFNEQLERKKAQQAEKLRNSVATVHRAAEEKRAAAEAQRGEEAVKAEAAAAKYRAKGEPPKKLLFGRG